MPPAIGDFGLSRSRGFAPGLIAALVLLAGALPRVSIADWAETLDRVAPAVVELRIRSPRAFDGNSAGVQSATGFVVDAEMGLILTNRHVVTAGPVVTEAIFLDNEEVEVQALYRDPVHDFGFYRFDPADVRFMQLAELELAPERARVGTEIRVIGNDAGEKLSILAGTLARLDRSAPVYGRSGYNDFNTFYYQAASGTSGGSSGSPVIDREGAVVALNAGGRRMAASSFYLPLERVVRALAKIRAGEPVSRGTLQVVFAHRSFDEIRRLGLRSLSEVRVREAFPAAKGMIVVDEVVPEGPADGVLEPGDVVMAIDGQAVTSFLPIEEQLDARVGETISLSLERGGQPLEVEMRVADLAAISPSSYLEIGGGVLTPLSYHAARNHAIPQRGVAVSEPGYMLYHAGVPRGAVITHANGEAVPDLEAIEGVLAQIPDGEKVTFRYFLPSKPNLPVVAVVEIDRHWFDMRRCQRDDATGRWPCRASPPPPAKRPRQPTSTELAVDGDWALEVLAPSLVVVEFRIPYRLDGVHYDRFAGSGLVVDAERGLVVVDRDTVPVALGDLTLTFGGSVEIPAEVAYLHPEHNFGVVRYDPAHLGDTEVESATLRSRDLQPGDPVWVVGVSPVKRWVSRKTQVDRREPLILPMTRPPRFRDQNIDLIGVEDSPATMGGVLADGWGRVVALWASYTPSQGQNSEPFLAGIPIGHVIPIVDALRRDEPVNWRSLGAEFQPLSLAEARHRGLDETLAAAFEAKPRNEQRVLSVVRIAADSPAVGRLREGDLLLSVDGQTLTRFEALEAAAQADQLEVRVLREGREKIVQLPTEALSGRGTERALLFAGALLQEPHRALSMQWGLPKSGVYVTRYWFGSPADRYGLRGNLRIEAVDGQPTPDLDNFLAVILGIDDRAAVRLQTRGLDGRRDVTTLKLDPEYWPTTRLSLGPAGWGRERLESRGAPGVDPTH
jgi:S1-C subfamily serine protease